MISFAQMWSNALGGHPISLNNSYIKNTFDLFASGKTFFDLDDFKEQMKINPNLLQWFSKPE